MLRRSWGAPVALLGIAALACGTTGGRAPAGGSPTAPGLLFADDFADEGSGWDTGSDNDATLQYSGGEYIFELKKTDLFIWGNPGETGIADAHIAVTARNVGAANDGTFGIICNYQDQDNFHYMGVSPDGYYAIIRFDSGEDVFLTSDENLWKASDDIEVDAPQYRLEADCGGDGMLRLTVNNKPIVEVRDDSLTGGGDIGLFAWTFEMTPLEVHFDNVVVTKLRP